MKTIAITGGIGSGKTTVADYLTGKGFTVIDADRMSREMTSPGGKAMPYILRHFGPEFMLPDGSLDRAKMRDLVFRDPVKKRLLEEGTTKVVLEDIEKIRKDREEKGDSALFFDIPLLFETGTEDKYDLIWVVTAPYDKRRERIMLRDSISPEIIDLIMGSQEDEDSKSSRADAVIMNDGSEDDLKAAVEEALKKV